MPSRCCIQYVTKSGRPSNGHRTRKDQSSSQFPRRVVLKNVLTIRQLPSSPMLVRSYLKSCMLGFSMLQQWNKWANQELPDIQAGFRKGWGTRDQIANICWIIEKGREFQKNIYSASSTTQKPLTMWITTNFGKFLKRWEHRTILPAYYVGQEATVRTLHGTTDWFKIGKGV